MWRRRDGWDLRLSRNIANCDSASGYSGEVRRRHEGRLRFVLAWEVACPALGARNRLLPSDSQMRYLSANFAGGSDDEGGDWPSCDLAGCRKLRSHYSIISLGSRDHTKS